MIDSFYRLPRLLRMTTVVSAVGLYSAYLLQVRMRLCLQPHRPSHRLALADRAADRAHRHAALAAEAQRLHKTKGGHGRPRTSSDLELRHRFSVGSLFILVGRHPRWLSLQDALPRLPVPSLEHTRDQLLETVRPIVNDHQYIQCQKAFSAFMQPDGEGQQLQARAPASHRRAPLSTRRARFVPVPVARPLRAQALLLREHQRKPRSSWLADWFLEYKYLRKREPLVYFSNWSPPPPPPCAALFAAPLMRVCRGACAVLRFGGRAGTGSTGRIRRAKGR